MDLRNPILPGFFPDPSIIRVDDDFYIVNSSFEYFPSIPLWHSKDLIHWRQIGNVIDREDQMLDLADVAPSGGVQAATIRHHKGRFYVTSTRVKREWPGTDYHFIVTSDDINGPWSRCHFIRDAEGIDSSLFFDEDGTAYFLANRQKPAADDGADTEIWMRQINLDTFELTGPTHVLWDGTGGIYPEGPRLFRRGEWYYLLIAEGGTLHNHTTSIARSRAAAGPYTSSPRNPVLTHKHLARSYPIQNVGHADMVELPDGSWWGVCLGSRPRGGFYDGGNTVYSFGGYYRNLGRETFAFPITWPADDLSPLFAPETGRVEHTYPAPPLTPCPQQDVPADFSEESLRIKWVSLGGESRAHATLVEPGALELTLGPSLEDTFLGVRQTSWDFRCSVTFNISELRQGDCVGLAAYIKPDAHLSLHICREASAIARIAASQGVQLEVAVPDDVDAVRVELVGSDQDYTFSLPDYGVAHTLDGRGISCDLTDSHTGVMLALVGRSDHGTSVRATDFSYEPFNVGLSADPERLG